MIPKRGKNQYFFKKNFTWWGKYILYKWIKSEIIWTKIALASHGHDRNYPNVPFGGKYQKVAKILSLLKLLV